MLLDIAVQKGEDHGQVLRHDRAEGPGPVGLVEAVDVIALTAEFFAPEKLQVLAAVEIVKGVPVRLGGASREKVEHSVKLVLGDGDKTQGQLVLQTVFGDLPELLQPAPSQGKGKGGTYARIVHLKIERVVPQSVFGAVHVPPDKNGARCGVTQAAAAVSKIGAQPGQVLQLQGSEIQHTIKFLLFLFLSRHSGGPGTSR